MESSNSERNLTEPITLDSQIKIHKCWEAICHDLDLKFFSPSLISRGVLTADESREILKEETPLKQNEKFLHLMLKRDNHSYDNLLSWLQNDYEWLAKSLSEYEVTEADRNSHIDSITKLCALPQCPACFKGRSSDVQKVTELLLGGHRLVNIKAFGGQGKTALATVIGHQFVSKWGIRSVMVDLRNIYTEEDVLNAVLFALRPSAYVETEDKTTRDIIEKICCEITKYEKKILIIFDNCESALNTEGQQIFLALLTTLNSNCRNALVLCTSRDAIVLPNMVVTEHLLESLSKEASMALLHSYTDNLKSVDGETLAAKCGFMALLLHTVGVLLSWGCSAAELLNELAASPFTLKTDEFDTHGCIDLTYRRLKLNEQKTCQLLSLFPSFFTSAQAIDLLKKEIQVAGTSDIEYRGLLQKLCKTSFLTYDATKKTYAMHSIIQAFAKQEIPAESADAYRLKFMSFMEPKITKIVGMQIKEVPLIFEKNRENFVQCIDIFAELMFVSQKRMYSTMRNFAERLQAICRFAHALCCFKILLEVQQQSKDADETEIARLLMQMGLTYSRIDNISESRYKLKSAVGIYKKLKKTYNNRDYHCCCYHLGLHCIRENSFLESLKWFDKCLKVSRNINDQNLIQRDKSSLALIKAKQGEKGKVMGMLQDILESDPALDGRPGGVDNTAISNAASALKTIGKNKEALLLFNRSLVIKQAKKGEHINTVTTLNNIGDCMLSIGDADGAVTSFQKALDMNKKIHGEHHQYTAFTIHNLANAMSAQGNHAEALSTYQRALRINEEVLGESASTATTLHKIGQEMLSINDPAGAVKSLQRALDIKKKIHGERHESTACTIHKLARAMSAQGNHAEALSAYQRALRIEEEVLGESASTATTLHNIGREMLSINDPAGAVKSFQRALDIYEKVHGEHHEYTACTIHELARAMSAQGNHAEALSTYQRALRIEEEVLGESASTASTLHNTGQEMLTMNDPEGAVKSFQRALDIYEKIHGEHHKSTACTIHELARAMSAQGNHAEALSAYQRALRIKEEVLGESESTACTLHNIGQEMLTAAKTVHSVGSDGIKTNYFVSAVEVFTKAIAMRSKTLGEYDYLTADTTHALGLALFAQGHFSESLSTFRKVLLIYEQAGMIEHRNTVVVMVNIALVMKATEDTDGAITMYRRALDLSRRVLGDDEQTMDLQNDLSEILQEVGHVEESAALRKEAMALKERLDASKTKPNGS